MTSSSTHWDAIFSKTEEDTKLGWYEETPTPTLKLLEQIPAWRSGTVFLPGAGTSILIEELLAQGAKLVFNDISCEALERVKARIGEASRSAAWICQDIAQPLPPSLARVDIWIDRAVLHFLTEEDDIEGYFDNVRSTVEEGGHAVFAEFSKEGAKKCAGLTLHRYSVEELSQRLGPSFHLVSHFDHTYINPSGDTRPYIYALFRRETGNGMQ